MDLVAHLENVLHRYQTAPPSENLRIAGWRFSVTEHSVVKAGIRDNRLGEVYAAPTLTQGISGDLLIIWPGDFCSHAVVNSAVISILEEKLPFWKQGAFQDPEGSVLIQPEPLPLVALEHREVLNMVKQTPTPVFHLLDRYRADLPARGIGVIQ
ncbi:MAG TPA: hypothetical protein VNU93_03145, partial [Verrucomicrobiae bacterium]|nr:hypothetical protein [Verrucomicrobiae bacterium]